jgi:protein-S-isoprenylcysteine O-methyltransferase Ste14
MMLFLKNVAFTVLVPGTVAVWIPWRLTSGDLTQRAVPLTSWIVALPVFVVGGSIYFWCLWDFASAGRGTPAPIDPPKALVVRGLYRYVRNPMYVGVLLVIAGWALLSRSGNAVVYGATIALMFHLVVLLVEEPMLRGKFGESYEAYCRAVHRWWPSFRP